MELFILVSLFILFIFLIKKMITIKKGGIKNIFNEITDFCEINKYKYNNIIRYPNNINELKTIVKYCLKNNLKIRIRGGGHSCSGISIPKKNEILVSMIKFNKYKYNKIDTIDVDAGVDITNLNKFLNKEGYMIPIIPEGINETDVYNPTIGGFICAGGICKQSSLYGGFWENVLEIKIMDGLGNIKIYNKKDKIYPWLFGNYGLLGIIISAKLKIINKLDVNIYPINKEGIIDIKKNINSENYIFYHILCDKKDKESSLKYLLCLFKKYFGYLKTQTYSKIYKIKYFNFNPPLLYPNREFYSLILIKEIYYRNNKYVLNMKKINQELSKYIDKYPNRLYRYPQVEYYNMKDLRQYYDKRDKNIFKMLLFYKRDIDPYNIINSL